MKTLHTLEVELTKTIVNLGFLISVLITLALQFTNQIYVDNLTGKTYSVIEVIMQLDKSIIKENTGLSAFRILQSGVAGYFIMFIPIIAAFPFIPNFCAERNSGLIRFTIQRTGKFRYYLTKFVSAALGGGLAVLFGYLLYGMIIAVIFPSIRTYDISGEELSKLTRIFIAKRIGLVSIGIFIYGAVSAIPAFLMAAFVKNRYIITCVPFLAVYLYSTSLTKLIYDGMEKQNQRLVDIGYTLKPEQVTTLHYGDSMARNSLLLNLILVITSFLAFVIIMNRRRDFGE